MDYHFNVNIATALDVDSAILIQNFYFWIKKNKANNKHFYDGNTWTYNSISALEELFPFWSRRQIERIINNLSAKGILIKGNYNENKYDRTTWYALHDSVQSIYLNGEIHSTIWGNGIPQTVEPIPYSKLNNNTNNSIVSETEVSSTTLEQKKEFQQSLFPETELVNPENRNSKKVAQKKVKKESEPDNEVKRLFRNSDVYKMAKFDENKNGDYSEFESRFNTPEFAPIDLVYYFHVVSDWSDLKNEKRTKNGWIATIRTFIRGDAEKNKVKLKPEFQPNKNDDNQAMLDILNSR